MIDDIIAEVSARKMELHVHKFHYKKEWMIELIFYNEAGDLVRVKRENTDFEAAIIAAYETVRAAITTGLDRQLPAPTDGLPF